MSQVILLLGSDFCDPFQQKSSIETFFLTKREQLKLDVVPNVLHEIIYDYALHNCEAKYYHERLEKITRFYDNFKSYFAK